MATAENDQHSFIILNKAQGDAVRGITSEGHGLDPVRKLLSFYILPTRVLNDPAHAAKHEQLASLPQFQIARSTEPLHPLASLTRIVEPLSDSTDVMYDIHAISEMVFEYKSFDTLNLSPADIFEKKTQINIDPTTANGTLNIIALKSISVSLTDHITFTEDYKPNDSASISIKEDYLNFLKITNNRIIEAISEIENKTQLNEDTQKSINVAKISIDSICTDVREWIIRNQSRVVNAGLKIGALGTLTAFLSFCGVHPDIGFLATAAVMEGDQVLPTLKDNLAKKEK
ncbi:hypothetical protein [Aquabacter sediminis]|uniref:hypothetical protein n=1 Tax=Aquabacter sediminis TaxID=3029197 RepID=UPI00237D4552|nr:hypothetical protein [Aquabacter sp. P-9]MDE1570161.1 hypothetical protein [Aquabacter sp. P-9]